MMIGDFSKWELGPEFNINNVLHQQGRVLLDSDWNAQSMYIDYWRHKAGQDIMGSDVAAVPAASRNSFKVLSAFLISGGDPGQVKLTLRPGSIWADGLLVRLADEQPEPVEVPPSTNVPGAHTPDPCETLEDADDIIRLATYFIPPIQGETDVTSISPGIRDAVILEVWRETINGFQIPSKLIEPALGGVDTTERIHTAMAFKLLRLDPGDTCANLAGKLQDDCYQKGRLTVTLDEPKQPDDPCPKVAGGGYTGFEHYLYRIEIAHVDDASDVWFKWSQFNGTPTGRGDFKIDGANKTVTITANNQAIRTCGLTEYYMEIVEYDGELGGWKVVYGATVTLNDDVLTVTDAKYNAAMPPASGEVFFRLWNQIRPISDFSSSAKLRDGINLEFTPGTTINYRPSDYWTFKVRAGQIVNPETLIDNMPPEGIEYHRVPIAILKWNGTDEITSDQGKIDDCRRIFHPLTHRQTCCTYRVGDGVHSYGDFDSIQEAVNHVRGNAEICVLPGIYRENIIIQSKYNLTIRGCGNRTKVVSNEPILEAAGAPPVFWIRKSQGIRLESMEVRAHRSGFGIILDGSRGDKIERFSGDALKTNIERLDEEEIRAGNSLFEYNDPAKKSVIKDDLSGDSSGGSNSDGYVFGRLGISDVILRDLYCYAVERSAIVVNNAHHVTIRDCGVRMHSQIGTWPGVLLLGRDILVNNNIIIAPGPIRTSVSSRSKVATPEGLGGIQVAGTSERVRITNNLIQGGAGNGITLGSIREIESDGDDDDIIIVIGKKDRCAPCLPPDIIIIRKGDDDETIRVSAGALYDIWIESNRILDMGSNGIGVAGFFDLEEADEFISVERLTIKGNEIRGCLRRSLETIPAEMIDSAGYGGISLADVEELVVQENIIEDNGLDPREPICGIFILHAEGIDITNNRIINNGRRLADTGRLRKNDVQSAVKSGRRGGINIVYGIAPTARVETFFRKAYPRQTGVPAVRIHQNIVVAPVGQALSMVALGPVSVHGNQFTTQGIGPIDSLWNFIGSTVTIMNLGISNEFYGQFITFELMRRSAAASQKEYPQTKVDGKSIVLPQEGLDDRRLGQYLANGNVMFNDNQCVLDLLEKGVSVSISSILIITLDDIGFANNQCDCSLLDDFIIVHNILLGLISIRMTDNRLKEGLFNTLYSALTFGMMNNTTNNQSTHCLLITGPAGMKVNEGNRVFLQLISGSDDYCSPFQLFQDQGQSFGQPHYQMAVID